MVADGLGVACNTANDAGFKTATAEELPGAVAVMDPLHVVRLAGDALEECRRRVQQAICGQRGRKGDPLYAARRTLHNPRQPSGLSMRTLCCPGGAVLTSQS